MTGRLTRDLDHHHHNTDECSEHDPRDENGEHDESGEGGQRPAVYGDAAYGSGANLAGLEARGIEANTKSSRRPHVGAGSPKTPSPSTSPTTP